MDTNINLNNAKAPILELKNISKSFNSNLLQKKHEAVIDLNCSFPKNSCTGLLGHNGAGKTTAIRIILGIIFPDQGNVLFDNQPMSRQHRNKIGYMPEINKLPLNMTPIELLWSQLKIYANNYDKSTNAEKCQQVLTQIGLWQHKDKKVKQLSKGMARRLAWALATIHQPDLLILDEPFSGLDPLGRKEMTDWILDLKNKDISIILCTHELWHVHSICDNIQILNSGKLVYSTTQKSENPADLADIYELQVSGTTDEVLQTISAKYRLPVWQNLDQKGWTSKMLFSEYDHAMKWLQACTESGFLILNFSSASKNVDHDLLQYFKIEESK